MRCRQLVLAFRSAARELNSAGYFRYRKYRNERGQIKTEILVSPTPAAPDATNQRPVCETEVEPHRAAVDRTAVHQCPNRKEENNKEQNNNQAALAAQQRKVVVDSFFIEVGLLELRELADLKAASLLTDDPQNYLDEVCGQIRQKGRKGESGIKHPARVLKMIAQSKSPILEYAADERERRQARQAFEKRKLTLAQTLPAPSNEKGVPCPPVLADRIDQLLGRKNAK